MNRDEKWLLEEKYVGVVTPEYLADKARLARGEPLAYVIGSIPFLGLNIALDSHPLIPRPETEWWTEQMLDSFSDNGSGKKALDLCAGSGAIGCAMLARLPRVQVFFGEIDPIHEPTILKNIQDNKLEDCRADVRTGDLFEPFGDIRFDLIAANPPYIPSDRALEANVIDYEPAEALFAGTDGLAIIRRIATELPKRLAKTGVAWIECDSGHAEEASALFTEAGFAASLRNDQYNKPRVLVVSCT